MSTQQEVIDEIKAEVRRLADWKHMMSYNDSYFGEPGGLVKQATYQLERLADKLDGGQK